MRSVLPLIAVVSLCVVSPDALRAEPILWEANGHWYEVEQTPLPWHAARDAVESLSWQGLPGHLATITSQEEVDWIWSWLQNDFPGGVAIGGYEYLTGPPADNWQWVTGEEWAFTNWAPGAAGL